MAGASVSFRGVGVRRGELAILEGVDAEVPRGSWTALIGPNGAGKTTLLRALLGEIACTGTVACDPILPRLGYCPQRLHFDRGAPLTVAELLACGRQWRPLWLGVAGAARAAATAALAEVDAAHLMDRQVGALSGGELQRVMLAQVLLREPDLLILDEPDAGVDLAGGQALCELLDRLRRRHAFTVLMVTHDLGAVLGHSSHVIGLNRSVVVQGRPRQVLGAAAVRALFGPHVAVPDCCRDAHGCEHTAPFLSLKGAGHG